MNSLGLSRPIIKSHLQEKWRWPWARGAAQILGFAIIFSAMAGASNFKFGKQLGFVKTPHKITRRKKVWAWPWARGAPQHLGVPLQYLHNG